VVVAAGAITVVLAGIVLSGQKNEDKDILQSTILYFGREMPFTEIQFGKKVVGTEEGISVEGAGLHNDLLYTFKAENLASPRFGNNVFELVKASGSDEGVA
jgi:hypothetical protein